MLKGIILSTAAAAAAYLIVVLWAGRTEVGAALRMISAGGLSTVLALSTLNYGLRFLRWHFYLRILGSAIPVRQDLRIYLAGFALTATPGKVGETARSLWLQPYGVSVTSSLAALLAERLQDFLAILTLSSVGVALYPRARWLQLSTLGLLLLALLVVYVPSAVEAALRFLGGRGARLSVMAARLAQILALARRCLSPRRVPAGLLIGVAAWGAESLGFFVLLRALGMTPTLPAAIFIYSFSTLAGALSFMPGGLGGSEATMILLLRITGVPLPIAVSATLLIRLATLWFAVAIGVVALLLGTRARAAQTG